jgi:pre-mRNA-splicing factor CWC22
VLTWRVDIFKVDPNYLENEEKYKEIKAEILGEGSDDEESGSEESSDEDENEDEDEEGIYLFMSCCTRILIFP